MNLSDILHIESVSQINEMIGNEKLKHPLIALLEPSKVKTLPEIKQKIVLDLYSLSLKSGSECKIKYGRQNYDFQEGTLVFLAPGQTIEPISTSEVADTEGWTLVFHPDLIRKTTLGNKINEYAFFYYDSNEALHVSNQERVIITDIAKAIKYEYSQNIDEYSKELIVSNIELLLNYCKRFYSRQMITRTNVTKDIVNQFEKLLKSYFDSQQPKSYGLPSVKFCSQEMGYSTNYLSDLLKKETGKNTKEHIQFYLIEKAKVMLLGTSTPINQIAYFLGFKYPQHFSTLFKKKTGMSPVEYRI